MKKCLSCNKEVPVDSMFCPFCGSKDLAEPEVSSFCRKCGKKLEKDSVFCSFCGEKVIAQSTDSYQPQNNVVRTNATYKPADLYTQPQATNVKKSRFNVLTVVLLVTTLLFAGFSGYLFYSKQELIKGLTANSNSGFHVSNNTLSGTNTFLYVYSDGPVLVSSSGGVTCNWDGGWTKVGGRHITLKVNCKSGSTGTIVLTEKETGKKLYVVVRG